MTLKDIFHEFNRINMFINQGIIEIPMGKLYSIYNMHPGEAYCNILNTFGWDVLLGETPKREVLEKAYSDLETYYKESKVKELKEPLQHFKEYLGI